MTARPSSARRWDRAKLPGAGRLAWAAMLCASAAGGGEPTREPNDLTVDVPVSLPQTRPAGVKAVAQLITLTDEERTVLEATRDRTGPPQETGLYMMLGVAGRLQRQVQLDPVQWDELDRPAYVNLLGDPKRYRGTPLRARVKVYHVWKLQPGAGLNFSRFWPKDRPVWQMNCVWADSPYQRNKPLTVYSVVDPTEYIGPPEEIGPQQKRIYPRGPEIRAAGLFYRTYIDEDPKGRQHEYPIVMAWQLSHTAGLTTWQTADWDDSRLTHYGMLVLLVVAMAVGYFFTRRRLARMRSSSGAVGSAYRRPRREPSEQGPRGPGDREPAKDNKQAEGEDEDAGPVDPDLTAAVEQYLHEKEDDDGTDRPG